MLEKLFRMVENAHKGMCIMVEYYHVIDYVISIYKSPSMIEENKPLIRTEGSFNYPRFKDRWVVGNCNPKLNSLSLETETTLPKNI